MGFHGQLMHWVRMPKRSYTFGHRVGKQTVHVHVKIDVTPLLNRQIHRDGHTGAERFPSCGAKVPVFDL